MSNTSDDLDRLAAEGFVNTDLCPGCRRMEELCLAAYERGERTTLRQAIDELRANPRVVEGHVTSMEVENERLRELIAKLRVRFIGVKTPHPAQHEWRELWDEMVAAEAGGK